MKIVHKMHNIDITFRTHSPLSISNGANDFLVDSDVLLDEYGIPYINQRRIKGLIKEAVKETLEICGNSKKDDIVSHLFGKVGDTLKSKGSLQFSNAYVDQYGQLINSIRKTSIPASFVKKYFCTIIQQTAIDNETHTAKKHSLRRIRAIKANVIFKLRITTPHKEDLIFVKLALLQLDFMGSTRNRGLGNVSFTMEDDVKNLVDQVKSLDVSKLTSISQQEAIHKTYRSTEYIKIRLLDKVIMTAAKGNENTVNTKNVIDGRNIWGMMAQLYLKSNAVDTTFRNIFRDGKIEFQSAYPLYENILFKPMPHSLQFIGDRLQPIDLLLEHCIDKTRPNKEAMVNGKVLYSLAKTNSFHFNRENSRVSGSSTDGELFYYEALNEGQEFLAKITGDEKAINTLLNSIGISEGISATLGRSKNVEYGNVALSIYNPMDISTQADEMVKTFSFYFISPCIVLNKYLFPEATLENLTQSLKNMNLDISHIEGISNIGHVQHFSSIWRSKTPLTHCFDAGSAFRITLQNAIGRTEIEKIFKKGIGDLIHQGYGRAAFVPSINTSMVKESFRTITYESGDMNHDIIDQYHKEKKLYKLKKNGLDDAKIDSKHPITNSQLKRIEYYIQNAKTFKDLNGLVEGELKKRTIHEVFVEKIQYEKKYKEICHSDYSQYKIYMEQYLAIRRLLNIKSKGNGNN